MAPAVHSFGFERLELACPNAGAEAALAETETGCGLKELGCILGWPFRNPSRSRTSIKSAHNVLLKLLRAASAKRKS